MTDDLGNLDSYFSQILLLMKHKKALQLEMSELEQMIEYQEVKEKFDKREGYNSKKTHMQQVLADLGKKEVFLDDTIQNYCSTIVKASEFDTRKLTIYLAKKLTEKTNEQWLPIKFLLKPKTAYTDEVHAYGLLLGQCMTTIPYLADTITLLDPEIPADRYFLKYIEPQDHRCISYPKVDNFENIWYFTSQNMICIGTNPKFNAFFNTNNITSKPFLHLPLNSLGKAVLPMFSDKLPRYNKYDIPKLDSTHPREMCLDCLIDLMDQRLGLRERDLQPNEVISTPVAQKC